MTEIMLLLQQALPCCHLAVCDLPGFRVSEFAFLLLFLPLSLSFEMGLSGASASDKPCLLMQTTYSFFSDPGDATQSMYALFLRASFLN